MLLTPPPSDWVVRFGAALAPGAGVLDLACGSGRHSAWFAQRGHPVTAVDRDTAAVAALALQHPAWPLEVLQADLEQGAWPLQRGGLARRFDAVVVTNYLWRERFAEVLSSVAPGGLLIYETFAQGHERYGRPARPAFLLAPGELLQRVQGWEVIAYEHGLLSDPLRLVQRIVARSTQPGSSRLDMPLR